jgi:hypothetical protein
MAKFSFNGMDEISASLEQIANLTDEDKMSVILRGARLLLERQREKIASVFKQRTGALANSLTIEERSDDSGVFAYIFPKGKHPGSSTGKRMKKGRSSGKYSGSNAEVAYILEYGSPRIAATHWLENANEESADELTETMQSAWNDMLTEKGL